MTKNNRTPIELLAPARNLESGIAAINYGADAVYIGASRFGARISAANSVEDIEQLCKYAHFYNAKVYATINTILFNHELEDAQQLIHQLWNAGCDALIIQDMGILEMDLPPIPLFASTQTHNISADKVKFLKEVGFQRVILARELSLSNISNIHSSTDIDLESFVHGALCVSYSGQCYMSYANGKRSGNRGECAQPCRLRYNLFDSAGTYICKNKHLLSLKDLCNEKHLKSLIDSGITSFKIEGRLKDEAYIKNIVSYYRQAIDNILSKNENLEKASNGETEISFTPNTSKTFNRRYTDYFATVRKKGITSFDTPKAIGEFIGEVNKCMGNAITINTAETLNAADGLCYLDNEGELKGFSINSVNKNVIRTFEQIDIAKGTQLYRNHDHQFEKALEKDNSKRRILISTIFQESENGFRLTASDNDGNKSTVNIECNKTQAENKTKASENIIRQLSKLGETPFKSTNTRDLTDGCFFIPASELNEMRRKLVEQLIIDRDSLFKRTEATITPNETPYLETSISYMSNVSNHLAEQFYRRHGVTEIEMAMEETNDYENKVLMTTKHCLKYEFGLCPKDKSNKDKLSIVEPLYLKSLKSRYRLEFDCKACVMKVIEANDNE